MSRLAGALTPRRIVEELDRHIVGQDAAKRAVAIALRNRARRQAVPGSLREEILPNNILMIGPTGVGKTEIARRLARLAQAPFLKVEASKFTEVGYVGRDVDSMVRDLVELAIALSKSTHAVEVESKAKEAVEERLLDLLLPGPAPGPAARVEAAEEGEDSPAERRHRARERLRSQLRAGELEERIVEVEMSVRSVRPGTVFTSSGMEELDMNLAEALDSLVPRRTRRKKVRLADARGILLQEETERRLDMDQVVQEGLELAQSRGIVFLDEIDKIAGTHAGSGPEVSREGVQRDLLPLIEGTSVATKYGVVRTEQILFIAAGAFHHSKPSDLIPELQGRLPIRVELSPLGEEDLLRILEEPENALLKQYQALLAADGCDLVFTKEAVRRIAAVAARVNETTENIGARRLQTVLTTLLEEVLFEAPDRIEGRIVVDEGMVERRLAPILGDRDLSRFIL